MTQQPFYGDGATGASATAPRNLARQDLAAILDPGPADAVKSSAVTERAWRTGFAHQQLDRDVAVKALRQQGCQGSMPLDLVVDLPGAAAESTLTVPGF
jgi:hypothetical protein